MLIPISLLTGCRNAFFTNFIYVLPTQERNTTTEKKHQQADNLFLNNKSTTKS